MKVPKLEACLCGQVRIYSSTSKGEEVREGKILFLQIPWRVQVQYGEFNDGVWSGTLGQFLTFAGAEVGIRKIEKDGEVVYENTRIPVPYPLFNAFSEEGLEAMNELRRNCFGDGFDYVSSSGD